MNTRRYTCLTVAVVLSFALNAPASPGSMEDLLRGGDVVVDQQPTRALGPLADTLALDDWGDEIWEQVADNIRLSQTATIQHVSFWGFYGGPQQSHEPPTGDETMRVRFYTARPSDGLPGDILLEESFLNPSRTATGVEVHAEIRAPEYYFQADLSTPITLNADTVYWLEVVQVGDVNSYFRWESGYGLVGLSAYINTYTPNWTSVSGSYAFQLSTLPEPMTLALLLCAAPMTRRSTTGRRCRG